MTPPPTKRNKRKAEWDTFLTNEKKKLALIKKNNELKMDGDYNSCIK